MEEVGCPPHAADAAVVTMELATRQVIIKELALHQAAGTRCGQDQLKTWCSWQGWHSTRQGAALAGWATAYLLNR